MCGNSTGSDGASLMECDHYDENGSSPKVKVGLLQVDGFYVEKIGGVTMYTCYSMLVGERM